MNARSLIPAILIFTLFITLVIAGPGCANIIPPSGGPRDSIPPVLLEARPGDSARNFTGNRIVFEFDEFIDVQNVQENILVSPNPVVNPTVDFKLKTMTVRLRDTLEPNTTYSINFGEAVKDFTEGNPIKRFSYIFSTGSYIDSLELKGNVVLAETGGIDTTLIVMLHTDPADSAVIKQKPRYIAKLDSEGRFTFRNLPPKTFYLYALKDEGGTRRYFSDKQLFAFTDSAVFPGTTSPVTLHAFATGKEEKTTPVVTPTQGRNRRNEATVIKRLKYETNLVNGMQDLQSKLVIRFENKLRAVDTTRIRLFTDTIYNPAGQYRFITDSTGKTLTLDHTWKENTLYHLVLDKEFGEDSSGLKLLKTDTLSFTTKKLSDYGSLKLKIRNIDLARNPVLQLLMNGVIYKSFPLSGPDLAEPLFLPGEFGLRILYDENKNGVWDPGKFFGVRKQPELVFPIERKIVVKANWQNEFEIAL